MKSICIFLAFIARRNDTSSAVCKKILSVYAAAISQSDKRYCQQLQLLFPDANYTSICMLFSIKNQLYYTPPPTQL